MGKPLRYTALSALCAAFLLTGGLPGAADASLDETKQLLQKGLTLVELDQEIARLSVQETRLGEDITKTEGLIRDNQVKVAETREHAGKVLRAYYMGDRGNLWMMLFSAKSLTEALSMYEYLSMIFNNDQHSLNAYSDSYKTLTESKNRLETERLDLQEVKAAFLAQRDKAAAVQKEIEETIRASSNAETLRAELDRFTNEWKEKGIPLFRTYLSSIAQSMNSLPELLTGPNGQKYLKEANFAKKYAVFEITDTDLIEFFRGKDPLFRNITFEFQDEVFKVAGQDNGTEITINGHFTIENTPVNRLLFHVDQLGYNGFILPDTSNRALEQEFDLGFTPSKLVSGFDITEVTMKGGKLSLKLKMN